MWFNNKCDVYKLFNLSVCALAKYEEASVKASHNQPYVYIINYFIIVTNIKNK